MNGSVLTHQVLKLGDLCSREKVKDKFYESRALQAFSSYS